MLNGKIFTTFANHNKLDVESLKFYYKKNIIDKDHHINQIIDTSKVEEDNQEIPEFQIDFISSRK